MVAVHEVVSFLLHHFLDGGGGVWGDPVGASLHKDSAALGGNLEGLVDPVDRFDFVARNGCDLSRTCVDDDVSFAAVTVDVLFTVTMALCKPGSMDIRELLLSTFTS